MKHLNEKSSEERNNTGYQIQLYFLHQQVHCQLFHSTSDPVEWIALETFIQIKSYEIK